MSMATTSTKRTAKISVFDRGFLFADGVYEVSSVLNGKMVDNAAHLARLQRSLSELDMRSPATPAEIATIQNTLLERNRLDEGMIYLQVTRGAADRDFAYPAEANAEPRGLHSGARAACECGRRARNFRRHAAGLALVSPGHQDRWSARRIDGETGRLWTAAPTTRGCSKTATSPRAAPTMPIS